ncbi:MAG TPA: hypothetical protein VGN34_14330 [Ktedonobacteraceae bacterium]
MSDNQTDRKDTTPQCHFCSSRAAALIDAPNGCTCSDRRYQYRCVQHMMRARDTGETYSLVSSFADYAILVKVGAT